MRVQISEKQRGRRGARFRCTPGYVRRDNHVVELQKLRKVRRHGRFALDDIQARPRNAVRSQSIDQRRCIHNRTASDVDEIPFRSEGRQNVRVDEVARPRAPWRSSDQEIGPRRELDETVKISIERSGDGCPVVIADLHVEAARSAVRNPAPDFSKTENTQTLGRNGRGVDTPLILPSTGTYEAIGLK